MVVRLVMCYYSKPGDLLQALPSAPSCVRSSVAQAGVPTTAAVGTALSCSAHTVLQALNRAAKRARRARRARRAPGAGRRCGRSREPAPSTAAHESVLI
jgi:hypothetical protein